MGDTDNESKREEKGDVGGKEAVMKLANMMGIHTPFLQISNDGNLRNIPWPLARLRPEELLDGEKWNTTTKNKGEFSNILHFDSNA